MTHFKLLSHQHVQLRRALRRCTLSTCLPESGKVYIMYLYGTPSLKATSPSDGPCARGKPSGKYRRSRSCKRALHQSSRDPYVGALRCARSADSQRDAAPFCGMGKLKENHEGSTASLDGHPDLGGQKYSHRLEEEARAKAIEDVQLMLSSSRSADLSRLPAILASQRQLLQAAEAAFVTDLGRHTQGHINGFDRLSSISQGCEAFTANIEENGEICTRTDIGAPPQYEQEINELSNSVANIAMVIDFAEKLQDIPDTTAAVMEDLREREQEISALDLFQMYHKLEALAPVQSVVMGAFEQYQETEATLSDEYELAKVSHDLFDGLLNQINFAYGQLNGALWNQVRKIEDLCEKNPSQVEAILEIIERQDTISKTQLEAEDACAPIHPQNYYMDTLLSTLSELVDSYFDNLFKKDLPQGLIMDMEGLKELSETEEFMTKIVAPYFPPKYNMGEFLSSLFSDGFYVYIDESLQKVIPRESKPVPGKETTSKVPTSEESPTDTTPGAAAPTIQNSHILEIIQFILAREKTDVQSFSIDQEMREPDSPRLMVGCGLKLCSD
eukprot:scaffold246_cov414-Prasinococcus_capsulatus_cf.AAC.9